MAAKSLNLSLGPIAFNRRVFGRPEDRVLRPKLHLRALKAEISDELQSPLAILSMETLEFILLLALPDPKQRIVYCRRLNELRSVSRRFKAVLDNSPKTFVHVVLDAHRTSRVSFLGKSIRSHLRSLVMQTQYVHLPWNKLTALRSVTLTYITVEGTPNRLFRDLDVLFGTSRQLEALHLSDWGKLGLPTRTLKTPQDRVVLPWLASLKMNFVGSSVVSHVLQSISTPRCMEFELYGPLPTDRDSYRMMLDDIQSHILPRCPSRDVSLWADSSRLPNDADDGCEVDSFWPHPSADISSDDLSAELTMPYNLDIVLKNDGLRYRSEVAGCSVNLSLLDAPISVAELLHCLAAVTNNITGSWIYVPLPVGGEATLADVLNDMIASRGPSIRVQLTVEGDLDWDDEDLVDALNNLTHNRHTDLVIEDPWDACDELVRLGLGVDAIHFLSRWCVKDSKRILLPSLAGLYIRNGSWKDGALQFLDELRWRTRSGLGHLSEVALVGMGERLADDIRYLMTEEMNYKNDGPASGFMQGYPYSETA